MSALRFWSVNAAQHALGAAALAANHRMVGSQCKASPLAKIPKARIPTDGRPRQMARLRTFVVCAILSTALATPAVAASKPSTRLVKCGSESCLLVSGQRNATSTNIVVNGHEVSAKGKQRWHVRLPVETVRAWSAPYARTIAVSVAGETHDAKLPIGMMGHADLAMLVVRVK